MNHFLHRYNVTASAVALMINCLSISILFECSHWGSKIVLLSVSKIWYLHLTHPWGVLGIHCAAHREQIQILEAVA